jgi:hypothetical protein
MLICYLFHNPIEANSKLLGQVGGGGVLGTRWIRGTSKFRILLHGKPTMSSKNDEIHLSLKGATLVVLLRRDEDKPNADGAGGPSALEGVMRVQLVTGQRPT